MNSQIRYGLAALVAAVLAFLVALVVGGTASPAWANMAAGWATALLVVSGLVLLIVGLVRKRPAA